MGRFEICSKMASVLQLVVTSSGPGAEVSIPAEIVIGTVPIRKSESSGAGLTVKAAARSHSPMIRRPARPKPHQSIEQ